MSYKKSLLKSLMVLCFTYILLLNCVAAQTSIGLQTSYIAPVNPDDYLYKPAVGIQLVFKMGYLDEHFKYGAAIGYYHFNPTQDTFHNVTLESGNGNTLLPSYFVLKDYSVYNVGIFAEYKILNYKLSPIIGLNVELNDINYKYVNYIPTVIYNNDQENYGVLSILPRIGVTYEFKEHLIFTAFIERNIYDLTADFNPPTFWKTSLNISYYFE